MESDIIKAKETVELFGGKKIIVMHCISDYPTSLKA